MKSQRSYHLDANTGRLFLVPTPIGNLEDMTIRAVSVLKDVDLIAAEDTRITKKLCHRFEIETPLVSYHEFNKEKQGKYLLQQLCAGKQLALVSDAGTPVINDPGQELVVDSIAHDIPVIPLPGANAGITAVIASGLLNNRYYFYGFLPRSKKRREEELKRLRTITDPLVFYEAPHRLQDTLVHMHEIFGDRRMTLAREITKRFEEFIRGTNLELCQWASQNKLRGEFSIVVEGAGRDIEEMEEKWWQSLTIREHVSYYIEKEKLHTKDAITRTAQERKLPKREVYQAYHLLD